MCQVGFFLTEQYSGKLYKRCSICNDPKYFKRGLGQGLGTCHLCSEATSNCDLCYGEPNVCGKCVSNSYLFKNPLNAENQICNSCTEPGLFKEIGLLTSSDGSGKIFKIVIHY